MIATASADHYLRLFTLNGMKTIHKIDTQDMLFAMEHVEDLTVVGTGRGNILVYDNNTGECLYGFDVMKKGVCRLLGLNKLKTRLVCAGEDENAMLLSFD
jgi:WD40 repeat protein